MNDWKKELIVKLSKNPSLPLIAAMLVGGLIFGINKQPAEMGLFIVACSICLAFANIDKIAKFKGAGFEAEMRKAVEEAYATMENLKALGKPLIIATFDNLTLAGRWGGIDKPRKMLLKDGLDKTAESLGLFDDEVQAASDMFFRYHLRDHLFEINSILMKMPNKDSKVLEWLHSAQLDNLPTIDELRNTLSHLPNEELEGIEESILDYEYYLIHKRLRRSESLG
ncbi:MAG: hypothetical protein RPU61_14440 [Candidatus Sedimenticola sp. (ex Thyasira tokunagai)]